MAKDYRFQAESLNSQGAILTHIITDKETGVQYLLAISPNMGSGLTVLVDKDGMPVINKQS